MKCRAKNPAVCRYHGTVSQSSPMPLLSPARLTEAALRISSGELPLPVWFNSMYSSYATQPKLLDIIPSPLGDIAVVWEKQEDSDTARADFLRTGKQTTACRYRLADKGKIVGTMNFKHKGERELSVNGVDIAHELLGKGYGSALYLYAAKQLGRTGQVLINGNIQSYDAAELWKNLGKHHPENVSKRTEYGLNFRSIITTLDFTKQ
jgi:predicted GNAT family acetyltransferase